MLTYGEFLYRYNPIAVDFQVGKKKNAVTADDESQARLYELAGEIMQQTEATRTAIMRQILDMARPGEIFQASLPKDSVSYQNGKWGIILYDIRLQAGTNNPYSSSWLYNMMIRERSL